MELHAASLSDVQELISAGAMAEYAPPGGFVDMPTFVTVSLAMFGLVLASVVLIMQMMSRMQSKLNAAISVIDQRNCQELSKITDRLTDLAKMIGDQQKKSNLLSEHDQQMYPWYTGYRSMPWASGEGVKEWLSKFDQMMTEQREEHQHIDKRLIMLEAAIERRNNPRAQSD